MTVFSVTQKRPEPVSTGADEHLLRRRFQPVFERIGESARQREQHRQLPYQPIAWLREAGFGRLRLPQEEGGFGASIPQLFSLLVDLAAADSNVAQALRGHFSFVEDRLNQSPGAQRSLWTGRIANGDLVGNGWTENGATTLGTAQTRLTADGEHWRLDGTKYYTTGSIFADWIDTCGQTEDGRLVMVAVGTDQDQVEIEDDWDGFGQRTTGSGTARFRAARVHSNQLFDLEQAFPYRTAFFQLNLVAVLAGIAQAIEHQGARLIAERQRVYSHGNAGLARHDAQVQQVMGRVSARAYAAKAVLLRAAEAAQKVYVSRFQEDPEEQKQARINAEIESAQAQIIAAEQTLGAATEIFNGLGASAIRAESLLDRHWRNARAVASHNPIIYKERIVGDWRINGSEPPRIWRTGVTSSAEPLNHSETEPKKP